MSDIARMTFLEKWYSRNEVKFEIIRFTYNREFAMILPEYSIIEQVNKNTRMLKVHNVQSFEYVLWKGLRMFERMLPYNLYYTLAKYKNGIPNQTMNLSARNNDEWTQSKSTEEIISYDFLIDIDARFHGNFDMAKDTTKQIKILLDDCNIGYELRFSGRGFHFIIPNNLHLLDKKYSLNPDDEMNIYQFYAHVAKMLNRLFSEMVDYKIYDSRRLVKCPYSIANYKGSCYVCLPIISDKQFNDFKLKDANPTLWIGKVLNRASYFFNDVKNNAEKLIKLAELADILIHEIHDTDY